MSAELGIGIVKTATEAALLIKLEELGGEQWVPRSVVVDDESEVQSDSEEGEEGEVVVKTWFAEKEGLV